MAKAYVKHDYAVTGRDYVETEGGGGGGGGVNYSAEEQDTGLKWTDEKEVYQITLKGTTGATAGSATTVIDLSGIDIDKIISFDGKYDAGYALNNNATPANAGYWSFAQIALDADNKVVGLYMLTGASFVSLPITVTFRYTKTE